MWNKKTKILFGCVLTVFLSIIICGSIQSFSVWAQKSEEEQLDITVVYGNQGSMQDDHIIPVEVQIENGSEPFCGEIQLGVPYMQWDNLLYTQTVELQEKEHTTVYFSIPLQQGVSVLSLQVVNKQGESIYSKEVMLPPQVSGTSIGERNAITVGVVGLDITEPMMVSEHIMQSGKKETFWIYPLEPSELYPSWGSMLMYDVLVCTQEQYLGLSDTGKNILQQWTFNGGVFVVFGVTKNYIDTKVDPKQWIENETLGAVAYSYAGDGLCLSLSKEVSLLRDEGLRETNAILNFLGEHFEKRFSPQLLGGSFQGGWQNHLQGVLQGWEHRFPNVVPYILVIAIYIVIALPLSYLFLKSRKKSYYLRGTVITLALCFSCLIFVMGAKTRMVVPHVTALAIESIQGEVWDQTIYACVQTPYQKNVTLQVKEGYSSGVLMLENRDLEPEEHRGLTSSYAVISSGGAHPTYFVGSHTVGTNYLAFHRNVKQTSYGLREQGEVFSNLTTRDLLWVGYLSESQNVAYGAIPQGESVATSDGTVFARRELEMQLHQAGLDERLISLFMCYYEAHPELFEQGDYWIGLYQEKEGAFIDGMEGVVYQGYGLLIQSATLGKEMSDGTGFGSK